jgi:hypothetical protein
MDPPQGSSTNSPSLGEMLQSYTTQIALLQVNMNDLVFNLLNLKNGLQERWAMIETRLENMEHKMMML